MPDDPTSPTAVKPGLIRGLALRGAIAVNMIDMIGVGPFITLPLIVAAMGGPQAMLGWILGAVIALCDGLVWAELGATFPDAGGSYVYLSECFGPRRWGRLFSFLFVWQNVFSAPLVIASGCIGMALYSTYLWPALDRPIGPAWLAASGHLFGIAALPVSIAVSRASLLAIGAAVLGVTLTYRQIGWISRVAQWLWWLVLATVAWVIGAGLTHFNGDRAFDFPPGAFHLSRGFLVGLGAALLIATYDYWGYENANYLGAEVRDAGRTLPRAILLSVAIVGVLYTVMNISVLGVLPWRELTRTGSPLQSYAISGMMERIFGPAAARWATAMVIVTAFASVFSLFLGFSRIFYSAAIDGNFFRVFSRLHPRHRFPHVSLLVIGALTVIFCLFRLDVVIAALVIIRVGLQYLMQAIGLLVLRRRHPEAPRPFRMWAYPLPAILAIVAFVYILIAGAGSWMLAGFAALVLVAGLAVFLVRAARAQEWPFARS